ncbi:SMP-30/gluconolactonase/LRE family protein [Paenibacillus sp. MBLB4367]|uniref:SMP-30/gluconolactonase/LRE family protein n=1 Tax=Paenibacillus sp. MBLB4367 TaxID=3384767 RepID=UPI0039081B24
MGPLQVVLDAKVTLGEGPSWEPGSNRLYWVDILGRQLHIYDPATGSDDTVDVGQLIGAVVPRQSGGVVMALQNGFHTYDFETKQLTPIGDPEADKAHTRFNDGKCDAAGRFWAGTMSLNDSPKQGALYCLETDGSIRKVIDGVTCSNGIAWNPDNTVMYYIDSPTRQVVAHDYDLATGGISNPRVVVQLADEDGVPDGMTSDSEGMLWVAVWGGWRVSRYNPETGEQLARIDVPAEKVTSCVFTGDKLNELYITSARTGIDEEGLAKQPLAGGLFRVKTDIQGSPTYAYGG